MAVSGVPAVKTPRICVKSAWRQMTLRRGERRAAVSFIEGQCCLTTNETYETNQLDKTMRLFLDNTPPSTNERDVAWEGFFLREIG